MSETVADAIRAIHVRRPHVPADVDRATLNAELRRVADDGYCIGCSETWPCATTRALERIEAQAA